LAYRSADRDSPHFRDIMGMGKWCPGKDWIAIPQKGKISGVFEPTGFRVCTARVYRFQVGRPAEMIEVITIIRPA
jgi:hypothetical protein